MKLSDAGFLRWVVWAYFRWAGRIKRLPYALAFFSLVLMVQGYTIAAAQWVAVNLVPPPAGTPLDAVYAASLASSVHMIPFILPACYTYLALDFKRFRSIGLAVPQSFGAAFVFSVAGPLVPIFFPAMAHNTALVLFAYHAILAIIPAKEDRLSPLERKYRTWQAIATGDGTPRRLPGAAVTEWRIVRQGPAPGN